MLKFKNSQGAPISLKEIVDLIAYDGEYEVFLGTDSQLHKKIKRVIYATCIVLYRRGKGGRIFMAREAERLCNSLKERLQNEVFRSLQVAFELKEILPARVTMTVHVDVNPRKKFKSGDYAQELVSMVTGQGFKCQIKPDAFAAQNCADKATK